MYKPGLGLTLSAVHLMTSDVIVNVFLFLHLEPVQRIARLLNPVLFTFREKYVTNLICLVYISNHIIVNLIASTHLWHGVL